MDFTDNQIKDVLNELMDADIGISYDVPVISNSSILEFIDSDAKSGAAKELILSISACV